ncbi:SRPBCC family protein [Chitinophaga lutea]
MRFVKMFLIAVLVFGGLIFLLSLLFPSTAVLERSGSIDAPIGKVYAEIADLKTWSQWNPWDPAFAGQHRLAQQYSDPASGMGAWYTWSSADGSTATGRVEIATADSAKLIVYNMTHPAMKPVKGFFELKPTADGKGTAIQWRMETNVGLTPWWKLRGFMMDRMFGSSMENGLNKLRTRCEGR